MTSVRLKFQIEYDTFCLDYVFDSNGRFAASLYDILQDVEGVVEEIVERGEDLSETGIEQSEEEDYRIIVVTDHLEVTDYEIFKYDLLKSFVGMEVYDFTQEITDQGRNKYAAHRGLFFFGFVLFFSLVGMMKL